MRFLFCLLAFACLGMGPTNKYRDAALSFEEVINENYAYLDRLPDGRFALTETLRAEAAAVDDDEDLIRFAERSLTLLADHHALTMSSFADSWQLVPTGTDIWVEPRENGYVVDAVRENSPAERAGICNGNVVVAINGMPMAIAVAAFWRELGLTQPPSRAWDGFAARTLVAGRRNGGRTLTIRKSDGRHRDVDLPAFHTSGAKTDFITTGQAADALRIRVEDSLGDNATIAAFDAAMMQAAPGQPVIIDLTNTPGGGNTVVAKGILGWFADKPTPYQMHGLPRVARATGIERWWQELVMPREGKLHDGPVTVRVGRWTGSMGEGLAIGFDALGARVEGTRMAGLRGAIYDLELGDTGEFIKLPVERLFAIAGTPREEFVPEPAPVTRCARGGP
ncbi:MAG: PDZ domain-containing protein [Pacificimonas sp.]